MIVAATSTTGRGPSSRPLIHTAHVATPDTGETERELLKTIVNADDPMGYPLRSGRPRYSDQNETA